MVVNYEYIKTIELYILMGELYSTWIISIKLSRNTIIEIKNSVSMFNRLDTDGNKISKLEIESKEKIWTKT